MCNVPELVMCFHVNGIVQVKLQSVQYPILVHISTCTHVQLLLLNRNMR